MTRTGNRASIHRTGPEVYHPMAATPTRPLTRMPIGITIRTINKPIHRAIRTMVLARRAYPTQARRRILSIHNIN